MKILTDRLEIRCMSEDMYKALIYNNNYEGITCEKGWPPEPVRKIIESDFKDFEGMPELMKWSVWVIIDSKTKRIIGDAGYKDVPDYNGMVEIGYGINEAYRKKGYCYEATRALIDMALSDERVEYVTAECLKDNTASAGVLKKLGLFVTHENEEYYYWTTKKVFD